MNDNEWTGYEHYRPPHSDFLVYWTGKDIEKDIANKRAAGSGAAAHASTTDLETTRRYLKRLKSILEYGLWMNDSDEEEHFGARGHQGSRPHFPRVCFTELKLSEARAHALHFGRLGIAFKRPFVVNRGGLPVLYYPQWTDRWARSIGREGLVFGENDVYASFLKRMGPGDGISYKYLNESEWRILFSPWLLEKRQDNRPPYATTPEETEGFLAEFPSGARPDPQRPRYLLSVNSRWLALIIYPSIQVLHAAQEDEELRKLLRQIKPKGGPGPVSPCETARYEPYVLPMEIELDTCRNL